MSNPPPAPQGRPIRLFELFALVLLWNSGYKGARVLNTLYALQLGATPFQIGLLLATYGLFALVLVFPAGHGASAARAKRRMIDLVKVPDLKRVFIASAV